MSRKTFDAWLILVFLKKYFIYLKQLKLEEPNLKLKKARGTGIDRQRQMSQRRHYTYQCVQEVARSRGACGFLQRQNIAIFSGIQCVSGKTFQQCVWRLVVHEGSFIFFLFLLLPLFSLPSSDFALFYQKFKVILSFCFYLDWVLFFYFFFWQFFFK